MSATATRPAATLKLERVSRWYGDVIALNDVDLTLGPGVTGLLGPNGAGKSTLIRLVTGLAGSGSGRVTLDGRTVRHDLDVLMRIGHVPDGDGLYDELPARDFLLDQARQRGFDPLGARARADEVLGRVGLDEAASRRTGSFSKGMRQRLKLAQALLHDPDVLVLDEPLTGLDPVMRRGFIRIVRELGDEGVTVLVSSHVLHEIEAMTDQVVLLHHGQVLAEGTVGHIRDLLDRFARRVKVTTDDPRALGAALLTLPELVSSATVEDHSVVFETMSPDRLCIELQSRAASGAARILAIEPLDEDLGSVFSYLVT